MTLRIPPPLVALLESSTAVLSREWYRWLRTVQDRLDVLSRVIGDDGVVTLPSLTTEQRDALAAVAGMLIYNTTTGTVQRYQGGAWGDL